MTISSLFFFLRSVGMRLRLVGSYDLNNWNLFTIEKQKTSYTKYSM